MGFLDNIGVQSLLDLLKPHLPGPQGPRGFPGNLHIYSTEPQVVGLWLNKKPIYEQTFYAPHTSTKTVFPFEDTDVEELVDLRGALKATSFWFGINYFNASPDKVIVYYRTSSQQFEVDSGSPESGGYVSVTVQWTKISDEPVTSLPDAFLDFTTDAEIAVGKIGDEILYRRGYLVSLPNLDSGPGLIDSDFHYKIYNVWGSLIEGTTYGVAMNGPTSEVWVQANGLNIQKRSGSRGVFAKFWIFYTHELWDTQTYPAVDAETQLVSLSAFDETEVDTE